MRKLSTIQHNVVNVPFYKKLDKGGKVTNNPPEDGKTKEQTLYKLSQDIDNFLKVEHSKLQSGEIDEKQFSTNYDSFVSQRVSEEEESLLESDIEPANYNEYTYGNNTIYSPMYGKPEETSNISETLDRVNQLGGGKRNTSTWGTKPQSREMGGKLYQKLQQGGPVNYGSLAMLTAAQAEGEKGQDPNEGLGIASGALKYGAMGLQTGNPYVAAGAALYGGIKGFADERAYRQRKEVEEQNKKERDSAIRDRIDESALKQYPVDGIEGSVNMFNYGGRMEHPFMEKRVHGGELVSLADGIVEVKADNPNKTDSVTIPDAKVKVDDGEIISGDYVTSDSLGFAKKHKKIAKRLGDLEKRMKESPNDISLANTYRRSKKEEENLQKSQEIIRNKLNLK